MSPSPMLNEETSGQGDNQVCGAIFEMNEYKKNGREVMEDQTVSPLAQIFKANDPDKDSTNTAWGDLTYGLTSGWKDSDLFDIDPNSGQLTPKASKMSEFDFDALRYRMDSHGIPDGQMRANVVVTDGGNLQADCDIFIFIEDVNEPPVIDSIVVAGKNVGEDKDAPFIMPTDVKPGDLVGEKLPAWDPDYKTHDKAECELDPGQTNDDRLLFGISPTCEIYVKAISSNGKSLSQPGGEYTLNVRAVDSSSEESDTKTYNILGKAQLKNPILDLESSANGVKPIIFASPENVGGVLTNQDAESDFKYPATDYSRWIQTSATALFAACTDENVLDRGRVGGESNVDCSTGNKQTSENLCLGTVLTNPLTHCTWDNSRAQGSKCFPREQGLRYKVIDGATFPEVIDDHSGKQTVIVVDKVTGTISLTKELPNYESLILPLDEAVCDLGPPVRGGGPQATPPESYAWVGRFPNGVGGVCRMFEMDTLEETGKKDKSSFLDAAALCAKGGGRLPLLSELETAAAIENAPTINGGTTTTPARNSDDGWKESKAGKYPLRAINILDTWKWPAFDMMSEQEILNQEGCKDNKDACPDTDVTSNVEAVNVWTYNGEQAIIGRAPGSKTSFTEQELYQDNFITGQASVTKEESAISMQDKLPVLCYLGEDYVNPVYTGDDSTENGWSNKASKPRVGYSALVKCLDTSDFTVNEDQLEYSPQPLKSEKYVFIEITDEDEAPYFDEVVVGNKLEYNVSITESAAIGTKVTEVFGNDEDQGHAAGLKYSMDDTTYFEFGQPEQLKPFDKRGSIAVNLESVLDFEAKAVHFLTLTVTDSEGLSTSQLLTIHVIDENEAPEIRMSSAHGTPVGDFPASIGAYSMKEDAFSGIEIGQIPVWDPDADTSLSFDISGAQNIDSTNKKIFSATSLPDNYTTSGADSGAGPTGKIYLGVLKLNNNGDIDYETKQVYELDVLVSDGALNDTARIVVNIENVDDVTLDDVRLLDWNSSMGTARDVLLTKGGERVLITGTNFGIKSTANDKKPKFKVTYGRSDVVNDEWFEATECELVDPTGQDNTRIKCNSAAGYGAAHKWRVEVRRDATGNLEGDATSDSPVITSYFTPDITTVKATVDPDTKTMNLNTRGNEEITLTGENFGPLNLKLEGYYGAGGIGTWYCAIDCTVTEANIKATCRTRSGSGTNHVWKLGVDAHGWNGDVSSSKTGYLKPTVSSVKNCDVLTDGSCTAETQNIATDGTSEVYITGENFGPKPSANDTCAPEIPAIVEADYENTWSGATKGYKYEVTGAGACVVTQDHTQIRCKTLPGVSKNFVWRVKVDGLWSDPSSQSEDSTIFYNPPVITGLQGPGAYGASTEGGQKFYLTGENFGPKTSCAGTGQSVDFNCIDVVTFRTMDTDPGVEPWDFTTGDSAEYKCSIKRAHTYIECDSPEGVGKNMKYKIQVGSQESPYNTQLSNPNAASGVVERPHYARPVVSMLLRSEGASTDIGSLPEINDADTRSYTVDAANANLYPHGGRIPETVVISGLNFGPINSGTCTLTGRPCANDNQCHNSTAGDICTFGEAAAAVPWNPTRAIYVAKKAESGQTSPDSYMATNCIVTKPHRQMKCDFVPGAGKSHEWTVTVGLQDSLTPTSSYHQPILDIVTGDGSCDGRCPPERGYKTNGGEEVVLKGLHFGPYENGSMVTYGKSGKEYTPTNCSVLNHTSIRCYTVPGIGKDLLWLITVRQQSNVLSATSSYASPFIHSVTPAMASADGSDKRGFLVYLNVSNSGLADPLTRRVVQFDTACKHDVLNSCGPYEISEEPFGPDGTRPEGEFDIIAFRLPMLLNKKPALAVPVKLVVYPFDRETGQANRGDSVESSNSVPFTYDWPKIDQFIVEEHPTKSNQLVIKLIGKNFGSIENGQHPDLDLPMQVLNVPLDCTQTLAGDAISCPAAGASVIDMKLNVNISNGPAGTYVQKWERGAENERYDEIVLVWGFEGLLTKGKLAVSRGGQNSNIIYFEQRSPVLESTAIKEHLPDGTIKSLSRVPTLGSKFTNAPDTSKDIRMEITCFNCGTKNQVCCRDACHDDYTCDPEDTCADDKKQNCIEGEGVPRDLRIKIGSAQLSESELRSCPIKPGSGTWDEDQESWTFTCYLPPYQGGLIDTRIQFGQAWSNPVTTRYEPPTIKALGMSLGGSKGTFDKEEGQTIVNASETDVRVLKIRTRGQEVKITGANFGIGHHGDVTGENTKNVLYDSGLMKFRPEIVEPPYHGGLSIQVPPGTSGRLRSVDVRTGQFSFDFQDSWTGNHEKKPVELPIDMDGTTGKACKTCFLSHVAEKPDSYCDAKHYENRVKMPRAVFNKFFPAGIGHHGDVTGENTKNVLYDSGLMKFRPEIVEPPYHGGLSIQVPPGTSGRLRSVDVRTGQFSFDFQDSTCNGGTIDQCKPSTMYIAYRAPTIVTELVPLWRFDKDGRAGGFEVVLYGYDFMSKEQIAAETLKNASYDPADHVSVLYKAERVNGTTDKYTGTTCVLISTDFDKIRCRVGLIQPTVSVDTDDDITIVVNVDGQLALGYLSESRLKEAKAAVDSNSYSEDDSMTTTLKASRDVLFKAQVDRCMVMSNGLTDSLRALEVTKNTKLQDISTDQERAFAVDQGVIPGSLTQDQKEMIECVSVVASAFYKACSGSQSEETSALLNAAWTYDESTRNPPHPNTRKGNTCPEGAVGGGTPTTPMTTPSSSPDSSGYGSGSDDGYDNGGGKPPDAIGGGGGTGPVTSDEDAPTIINRLSSTNPDVLQFPTRGGDMLDVKLLGFDIYHKYRAYLVDDSKTYPRIPVRGGVSGNFILNASDFQSGVIQTVFLRVPPGQGQSRRIEFVSDSLFGGIPRKTTDSGEKCYVGYAKPVIDTTKTAIPVRTTTDTCLPDRYESPDTWSARTEDISNGVVDGIKIDGDVIVDDRMLERRCLHHDTIVLTGDNFGEATDQLEVWVDGQKLTTDGESATGDKIRFEVFNGASAFDVLTEASDVLKRGFAGSSSLFTFEHTHNRLVLRGPRGYGPNCKLHVKVADQEVEVDFSFKAPEALSATPVSSNPRLQTGGTYNARGELFNRASCETDGVDCGLEIIGSNFGGVTSYAEVKINGEKCEDAQWNPLHPTEGLPFIRCIPKMTLTGISNISVFVAGQQGEFRISDDIQSAGVRAICKASTKLSDIDQVTGKPLTYWGRSEPAGELCAECQEGTLCEPETYNAPIALAGYYIVDLDITATSATPQPSGEENLIDKRTRRDYDRALEKFLHNGQRVCAPERLLDGSADATIVNNYGFALATKRDFCPSAQPCKPAEACKGSVARRECEKNGKEASCSECEIGYQYQELRCNASSARRNEGGSPAVQSCNHTLQCQSRSSGAKCTEALSSVCDCPAEWELRSHSCLKTCVKNKRSELEKSGCSYERLEQALAGLPCAYDRPEDCAKCVQDPKICVMRNGTATGRTCSWRSDCEKGETCQDQGAHCECGPTERCVICTAGTHYRLDGKCEKCPENIELVFAMFFVGIIMALIGAYILDQKKFNLAFLIIPVDYFQVLALLSRADIRWPDYLLAVLRALQFFNFNVDIATPECLLAGVFTYEMKYYGTLLAAPAFVFFLALSYVWHQCFSRVCMHRKPDKLFASKLVGVFMLLIYCVYLSCTTRALEVFNCSPTDPDDGWTYVGFTDLSCDGGGLCRCGDPEHLPSRLIAPSLLALGIYTLGFPVFLFWLLRCGNRKSLLKEDQILRASGLGDSPETNPRAYHMRVRYHKLYYYFKPGKSYWMLIILTRKVGIAFCSLVFRTNPGFMLASVVLILFVSFSLQTRHNPYMSASQRQLVLAEHSIKAEAGDHMHLRIRNNIEHVKNQVKRRNEAKTQKKKKMKFTITGVDMGVKKEEDKVVQFFFDYNTVEQFLLFCAVLVCLAGVMFESDRFKETIDGEGLRYSWQRDMVTFFVAGIVMSSLLYVLIVVLNELTGWTPPCLHKCHKNKEDAMLSAAKTIQNQKDDHIEMSIVNPTMISEYVIVHFLLPLC